MAEGGSPCVLLEVRSYTSLNMEFEHMIKGLEGSRYRKARRLDGTRFKGRKNGLLALSVENEIKQLSLFHEPLVTNTYLRNFGITQKRCGGFKAAPFFVRDGLLGGKKYSWGEMALFQRNVINCS